MMNNVLEYYNYTSIMKTDLWTIREIRTGLIHNIRHLNGKIGFFSNNARVFQPLAIYNGACYETLTLPQGTLIEWRDKCIEQFGANLQYQKYMRYYEKCQKEVA
jgi:hypothetical protein